MDNAEQRVKNVVHRCMKIIGRLLPYQWTASDLIGEGKESFLQEKKALYAQFVHAGSLCFDIGANVGDHTDIFLSLGAHVICVEPQPDCVETLCHKYPSGSRVVVVPKGVADSTGVLALRLCKEANTLATFSDKWRTGRFCDRSWPNSAEVATTTLEELIREFGMPDFCKIDVEGYEPQVLQGLNSPVPVLAFEFTMEFLSDARACVDRLVSLGYEEFNCAVGEAPRLLLGRWGDAKRLMKTLSHFRDNGLWGDIYARCANISGRDARETPARP